MEYKGIMELRDHIRDLKLELEISEKHMAAIEPNNHNPQFREDYEIALSYAIQCKLDLEELQAYLDSAFDDSDE